MIAGGNIHSVFHRGVEHFFYSRTAYSKVFSVIGYNDLLLFAKNRIYYLPFGFPCIFHPVQDITFLVEGPVVEQMARVFEEDWIFTGKKPFVPAVYPHSQKLPGDIPARIIPDGPDSDYGKLQLMLCGALNCAHGFLSVHH